jgi:hypothetical protein
VSAALLDPPRLGHPLPLSAAARRERGHPGARRPTLEERLEVAWGRLDADGVAECPVCRAPMHREGATGRCGGCGSTLS